MISPQSGIITTSAAISCRYQSLSRVVLCLAGDGAYNNGISHEEMNMSCMAQFENGLMNRRFGVPIIYGVVNNQYGMSGQFNGEISGIDYVARRAVGYNLKNIYAVESLFDLMTFYSPGISVKGLRISMVLYFCPGLRSSDHRIDAPPLSAAVSIMASQNDIS